MRSVVACLGLTLLLLSACGGSTNGAGGSATCPSVCDHIVSSGLACAPTSSACTTECSSLATACASDTHGYQTYLDCLQGASFSCNANGAPIATCAAPNCGAGISGSDAGPPGTGIPGGTAGDSGAAPSGPDATCAAKATQATCFSCCRSGHFAGSLAFQQAITSCECGASGACASQCASETCANPGASTTAGDACDACISTTLAAGGSCIGPVSDRCAADADCTAYITCGEGCTQAT